MRRRPPQRTCTACRQVGAKRELVRVVRTPDGRVVVDWTGKAPGRGAYIGPAQECLRRALDRRALQRALAVEITAEDRAALEAELYKKRPSCPWQQREAPSAEADLPRPADAEANDGARDRSRTGP